MATGRIRRTARRGVAAAVLGWLGVTTAAVLLAPNASAAPTATVHIRNVTPPVASVDQGGTVTFINEIPAQNKGGISIPLVGTLSATVYTDVSVTFFGQQRALQPGQSATWTFNEPATAGTIGYAYRIVPQSGLAVDIANQVINTVAQSLPALPASIPYVVQTIAPAVPNLPSVNVPQLPQVTVPNPLPQGEVPLPGGPAPTPPDLPTPGQPQQQPSPPALPQGTDGTQYQYGTGGVTGMTPVDASAAAAFDPSRFYVPGQSFGTVSRGGAGGGGVVGQYDGATVPVFGDLAGLDGANLEESADRVATPSDPGMATLPIAALVAVVALATVTAALVRTQQANRGGR